MKKPMIIASSVLALFAGGLVAFNIVMPSIIAGFIANAPAPTVVISASKVSPSAWNPGIETIGTAKAVQGVDLSTEAAGVVREIAFKANDRVEKGALLLQIDDRSERADLAAAESALELAKTDLDRAKKLEQRGVSSTNALQTAQTQAASAEATVAKLRAALETKRLLAPFSGTIGIPQVEAGQFVTAGLVYATLQDTSAMRVDFALTEQQAPLVTAGAKVTVTSEVGDVTATGTVTGIEPKIDPNSRLVTMRAEVESKEITPGQFLRVRVELPEEKGVIALPQTVVASSLYGDSVYVVRESEAKEGEEKSLRAEQVFVQTGRRSGKLVEIREGLKDGDLVVNAGQNKLTPGAPVKVDNTVTPDPEGAAMPAGSN